MESDSRIFVAGHRGLAGSSIVRALQAAGHTNLLLIGRDALDLRDRPAVDAFFARERPEFIFLAAAKVGGILANSTYPAEFLYDNLVIQTNVIDSAWHHGARKLLFLGSSCIYPRMAPQPIREEYLMTGELEPTNEWYAVAKIAGIKMCQAYRAQYGFDAISLMPTNLYGPGDNFHPHNSHVLPALIRRFAESTERNDSEIVVWGSGTPRREFLHVDDLASAALFLMETCESAAPVNVGTGEDVTIRALAEMIARLMHYKGNLVFDTSKPDGTPRKLLDVSRINNLGWKASIPLEKGLEETIRWYLEQRATAVS
jgi:GDP-L-fucose synthase